ncbi:MAG: DUF4252 domain-containing protein [Acidobacteria bacterium]|nr:DUF4252 domain-containing protein [Acidobacteriota bacterium]
MKLVNIKSWKVISLLILFSATASWTAQAQDMRLQLTELDKLEARATKTVDVTLDGKMLQIATPFLDSKKPQEAAIKELLAGLKGVYVKVFEFDKEGEYSIADVDSVRTQLRAPNWSKMVGVKSKKGGENVEVYMMMTAGGGQIGGIAVIATEPKQLTVVNIVGLIDLEKLVKLSGKFGIPSIDVNIGNKEPKE